MKRKAKACIRCNSGKLEYYAKRFYCLNCGFTFHKDSVDQNEELNRREFNRRVNRAGLRVNQ